MNKELLESLMAKMNDEQKANLMLMMDIIRQSEPERIIRVKGRTYYAFTLKNLKGADQSEMRLIVGVNGWTFCPANVSISKCLWF